MICVSNCS